MRFIPTFRSMYYLQDLPEYLSSFCILHVIQLKRYFG